MSVGLPGPSARRLPWAAFLLAVAAGVSSAAPGAPPARQPVLKQVRVPHPYYWREMYVPQVTSGPNGAAWSPDGAELVFAMQGSLWRQRLGSDEARQLTDGPGYDHQPEWSPDGRHVAYVSYFGDAVELRVLDLETMATAALVADGSVHVDPRWSPDGRRLAFVSTAHEGRWHVFVGDVAHEVGAPAGVRLAAPPQRITEDKDSGLPRYYYSRFDHYLSPTWSPDGAELIVISNRDHIPGSGGLWRMAAAPGAPMRALHFEETTWKARPDWARDGRRVVFASYHGRQWHQLWLTTAEGGDPFALTYGEFDTVAPRWSPDGRRIAYVSNEGGNTSLWVVDVPGGRRTRTEPGRRTYLRPVGRLNLTVTGRGGVPVPARLSVTGADGRGFAPDDAWRHADEAFVRGEQRFEHSYFHSPGRSTLTLPAGRASVEAWKGPEYAVVRREVEITPNAETALSLPLTRLADLPAEGRWGGDLHVHMNYGGAYRNSPAYLARQGQAEGLHVLLNLVVNKEQRIPDIDAWRAGPDPVSTPRFLLMHGQEYHTSFWGHLGLLGLRDHYLLPDYAGYPGTAAASLVPTNSDVAQLAHAQGALVGYVHPFDRRPDPDRPLESLALPIDAALGTLDYMEVMGFSDHLVTSEVWYRLLNCGFRIAAGAGTDAFPNFASLRGPAGLVRVYVRAGPRLDHAAFLDGLKAGRTFVTNAPLLWFSVDGSEPGDTVRAGAPLAAKVRMVSAVPVDHVEIVGDGRVVATVPLQDGGTRAEATVTLPAPPGHWYVLRARGDRPRLPVLDLYPFASTSPVYVERAGRPRAGSAEDAMYFAGWIRRAEETVAEHADWNTPAERTKTLALMARARAEFERRAAE
jgi:TolB protein